MSPIILAEGRCVEIADDWHIHVATADPVLRGIFAVNGHDYFRDGKPLSPAAPRIVSARDFTDNTSVGAE